MPRRSKRRDVLAALQNDFETRALPFLRAVAAGHHALGLFDRETNPLGLPVAVLNPDLHAMREQARAVVALRQQLKRPCDGSLAGAFLAGLSRMKTAPDVVRTGGAVAREILKTAGRPAVPYARSSRARMLWCWRCRADVPMLDDADLAELVHLRNAAIVWLQDLPHQPGREEIETRFAPVRQAYYEMTGHAEKSVTEIFRHAITRYGSPCSACGRPLRTPSAKHCAACGAHRWAQAF